jgi:adenosine 3'-phospho 5'-phosphosulfate transporter B3
VPLFEQTLSIYYLNFPTVVIFKSAKLLPVMAVNTVWLGRRQHPLDVIAALLMCLGLMLFTAADSKLHPDFHPKGVLLLLCALCADACISNLQEATMRLRNTPVLEMVLYGHTFALAFLLPAAVVGGELAASLFWLSSHPSALGLMVLYSCCGFLGARKSRHFAKPCAIHSLCLAGVSSVFGIVESFGCVVAVATTTFRKAVTMLISFLVFPKPFSIM